jgi:hypothetical protein
VPRYDFNWQHWYQLESALPLAPVDAIDIEVHFDNSKENPTNPAPEEYVTWGDQTWNEMAVAFLDIAHPRDVPMKVAESNQSRGNAKQSAKRAADDAVRRKQIQQQVKEFLKKMDLNEDGIVELKETPVTFQRFGFRNIDANNDGRLDRGEIEAAAEQRL